MGRQPGKMAGLEMGAHQYGCAIYQLPHTHPQMEKAESAWLDTSVEAHLIRNTTHVYKFRTLLKLS